LSSENRRCSECAAVYPETEPQCPVCGSSESIPFTVEKIERPKEPRPDPITLVILNKVIGSVIVYALAFAGIIIVVTTLRGDPIANGFATILRNWWTCLLFGAFVTIFRLFGSDFWKS
jgi:hypothetical protein